MTEIPGFEPPGSEGDSLGIEFLDQILQGLFGIGLKLESCLAEFEELPVRAQASLEGTMTGLEELTELIRGEIQRLDGSRNLD